MKGRSQPAPRLSPSCPHSSPCKNQAIPRTGVQLWSVWPEGHWEKVVRTHVNAALSSHPGRDPAPPGTSHEEPEWARTESVLGSTRPVPQSPGSQINKAGSNRDNRTPEDQREGCRVGKPWTSALAGS